jgi:hypothetical protein
MRKTEIKTSIVAFLTVLISFNSFGQSFYSPYYSDTIAPKRFNKVVGFGSAAYVGGLSFLSFIWYKDVERVPFHWYNDGLGYLQMDKFGHAYGAYYESYYTYNALRWAGVDKKTALLIGGPMGIVTQTPIEVFDGLYEGWGFSWWDMAANTFGAALFTAQEAIFDEQPVVMKFSYSPSEYPRYHPILGENNFMSFFLDYNAHTYWFSGNINKISGTQVLPGWLNLAVGYSANGMIHEFENPKFYKGEPFPHLERYRQFFISLDIDFTRIPNNKPWLIPVLQVLNMVKVPFPALEFNRIDGLKFRPLYF